MIVNRIKSVDIHNKGLFTAFYGQAHDLFMGPDLRKYSFDQQLYLYLKQEGFDSVVFYDPTNRFHSYGEKDLILFLKNEAQSSAENTLHKYVAGHKYTADHINSPLRGSLRQPGVLPAVSPVEEQPSNPNLRIDQKHVHDNGNKFYFHNGDIEILRRFKTLFYNKDFKLALIIKTPSNTDFKQPDEFGSFFNQLQNDVKLHHIKHKILITYGGETSADCLQQFNQHQLNRTFFLPFFQSHFIKYEKGDNASRTLSERCVRIQEPDRAEIANFIDYHRIVLKYPVVFSNYEKLTGNLFRGEDRGEDTRLFTGGMLADMKPEKLDEMSAAGKMSGLEELEELIGLATLKKEIKAMINAGKYKLKTAGRIKESRHIMLTGKPGTGKTQVARLIGRIFQEEGLLRRGHFVPAKLSDLKGNVVGDTPLKTQAVIERAMGGVLFIDEAHQIAASGRDTDDFNLELVRTLMQEMENRRDDLLVIAAGYQEPMKNFLKLDPGLDSRFPYKFHFPDYAEEDLLEIFKMMASKEHWETTPDFMECIKAVIHDIYKRESHDAEFGNARSIRTLIEKTGARHGDRCISEGLEKDFYIMEDIPESYLKRINKKLPPKAVPDSAGESANPSKLQESLEELNNLVGLSGVKSAIAQIVNNLKFEERRKELGLIKHGEVQDLNFVFSGNPGTGKTTVARLLGSILREIGVLSRGHVVEVNREKLIAGFVGQTAIKTRARIDEALDGVLFIDEAYSLLAGGEFGQEVIDQLLVTATDPKYIGKISIVIAGYPEHMQQFIASNPGLYRRLPQVIHFEDYNSADLVLIFEKNLTSQNFLLGEGVREKAFNYFESIPRNPMFGNAGVAVLLASTAKTNLNKRLSLEAGHEELMTILVEDLPGTTPSRPVEADSLALEVLPNYNPNNPTDVFIKDVCDDLQEVLSDMINAFASGDGTDEFMIKLEDEKLQHNIKEVLKLEGRYDLALFREITEKIKPFGLFFRGITSFNHNQISEGIQYLRDAQLHDIEELRETLAFLIGYWEILLQLNESGLESVKTKLKRFKDSLGSENVNPRFKEMSDMIQSDILFVSALDAIGNSDIQGFTESMTMAAETTSKIADDYHDVMTPSFNIFKGLSDFYQSYKNIVITFYKTENNDFDFTEELVNLSLSTDRFKSYFRDFPANINPRLDNMSHLMAGFEHMTTFFQALSIVAGRSQNFNFPPSEVEIKQLNSAVKNASEEIKKVNDEEAKAWIEICNSLIEYVSGLASGNPQELNLTKSYGYFNRRVGGLDTADIEKENDLPLPQAIRSTHNFFMETQNIESTLIRLTQFAARLDDTELQKEIEIQKIQFFLNMKEMFEGRELKEHIDVKRNRTIYFLIHTIEKLLHRYPLQ